MPRQAKKAGALPERRGPEREDTFTFEVELTFPEDLHADAMTLIETIGDAIYNYDFRNRLLPGIGLPRRGERLIGSAVGLTKHRVAPSLFQNIENVPAPVGLG